MRRIKKQKVTASLRAKTLIIILNIEEKGREEHMQGGKERGKLTLLLAFGTLLLILGPCPA